MMHPSRMRFKKYLLDVLGPDTPIAIETGYGRWDTGKRAWQLSGKSDYHFVIQDDAVFCKNFLTEVQNLVNRTGTDYCISLYYSRRRKYKHYAEKAINAGLDHVMLQHLRWGVGIGLRTDLISGMIRYCDQNLTIPNYDMRIKQWLLYKNIRTYYPLPSLLDHRPDVPSLTGHSNGTHRRAILFKG
jgi:hypothetical protein